MIKIVLREYLEKLRDGPPMFTPPIREFIEEAQTTESNFYKFLRDEQKSINRDFLDASIRLLRSYGFNTQIEDILEYKGEI